MIRQNNNWHLYTNQNKPEFGKAVLCYLKSGLITIGYRVKVKNGVDWQMFGDLNISIGTNDTITHWMPLPIPPKP